MMYVQGRHSKQCHWAMARVDLLPRPLLTYIYWAPRKKDSLNPRSGTGCFYLLLAPMNIFHDQTMPFSKMKLWLILELSQVCSLNFTQSKIESEISLKKGLNLKLSPKFLFKKALNLKGGSLAKSRKLFFQGRSFLEGKIQKKFQKILLSQIVR